MRFAGDIAVTSKGISMPFVFAIMIGLGIYPSSVHATPSADAAFGRALNFRDIFLGTVAGRYTEAEQRQLVYLPTPELLTAPTGATSAEDFFARLQASAQSLSPMQLYELGARTPSAPYAPSEIEDLLRHAGPGPITVVLLSGIFSEFITTRTFEDVLEYPASRYRTLWQQRLAAFRATHPGDAALTDMSFSPDAVQDLSRSIEALVHVSSIDAADGTPLVNLVVPDVTFMSLESMGKGAARAAVVARRMDKFFRILGAPHAEIVLMGYSLGTVVALEMLARGAEAPERHPWLQDVHAMIALGGTTYGSELADEATAPDNGGALPAAAAELRAVAALADALQPLADAPDRKRAALANTTGWARFAHTLVKVHMPHRQDLLAMLRALAPGNIAHALHALRQHLSALHRVDPSSAAQIVMRFGFQSFDLRHPVRDYDRNVLRFKALARAAVDSVEELSSAKRSSWWRANVLPTHDIKYYAISATMLDDSGTGPEHALATNATCYNPQLLDDDLLRSNYKHLRELTGVAVNDSQMLPYKVRFWNEVNTLLNPAQPPLDATYLGVLGTHHWGLALRVINEAKPDKVRVPYNPFPRAALLEALAAMVAQDRASARLTQL